ncbi:hypothetical protein PG993_003033 [Apiospora rasikravindrae]|uniref:Heterokaryon incompatibility domain-containing protein n=1 Tax=Apiospora rasikravindrae TaxID=990691 RepID=A0ABR1U114_9PEZI
MRLINVHSYELHEFWGSQVPTYAILTHTWDDEEVTHQEWLAWLASACPSVASKKGFQKIMGACERAKEDRLAWLWVDTNCIDKASSAELSEAINSMYAWYRDSTACYCYMADVPAPSGNDAEVLSSFRRSRWFTRGWTLQELLATSRLVFYSQSWTILGTKTTLAASIAAETGIDMACLSETSGQASIRQASVAKKMSWLARRETTRVEDIAYCMLGLFEINMPLLYGEGMRAFTRLQEEILRSTNDHTIFCWAWNDQVPSNWVSMLAPAPCMFKDSADYVTKMAPGNLAPYSITNLGLSISLPVLYTLGGVYAALDAGPSQDGPDKRSFIHLCRISQDSMIFERSPFPRRPVAFTSGNPVNWCRRDMIVQSKPEFRPLGLDPTPRARLGLFILTDEEVFFERFEGTETLRPSPMCVHRTLTFPSGLLDSKTNLLFLSPPSPEAKDGYHTAMVAIQAHSYRGGWYLVFFAAAVRESGTYWFSSATHTQNMPKLHPFLHHILGDNGGPAGDYEADLELAYNYMRTRAANSWDGLRNYGRQDVDFHVGIGDELEVSSKIVVRVASLRTEDCYYRDAPHPCLISV